MDVRVISETDRVITLGWTPTAGQEGYLPLIDGSEILTDGKRHPGTAENASSVKVGKPDDETNPATKHRYGVRILGEVDYGEYNPVAPPPEPEPEPTPQPPANALFDGRAVLVNKMRGCTYGTTTGAYMEPDIYSEDANTYYEDDFTLVADSRFSKVFRIRLNNKSRNPFWVGQPSTKPSAEVTVRRPITLGQVDWYALSLKFQAGWEAGDWGVVTQLGYPTLASPPLAIAISLKSGVPKIGIDRHAGYVTSGTTGLRNEEPRFHDLADVQGKWLDFLIGVKWTVDNSGWVKVETRLPGQSWAVKYDVSGTPTWQVKSGDSPKATVMDKIGAYQDASDIGTFENVVFNRGLMRYASRDAAAASLG